MKTVICIEVDHKKPIPHLADLVAGRAWSISGVSKAEVMKQPPATVEEMERAGFTLSEISLGAQEEVKRG